MRRLSETDRLEAFSDGVMAVIITIMAFEIKSPGGASLSALHKDVPNLLVYVLSFAFVGIYWNNHHHLLHAAKSINGGILWANLHLLFWLSLAPFATAWLGQNFRAPEPVALYGVILLMAGVAYYILTRALIRHEGQDSALARFIGRDRKGVISVVVYAVAIPLAFSRPWIADSLYVLVAILWLCPDPRIEKHLR